MYEVGLRSVGPSAFMVPIRKGEGSVEVRPRDHVEFTLPLDGRQHFAWHEPFVVVVRLANGQEFRSPSATLGDPPHHGKPFVVPDLDAVPAEEIYRIRPEDLDQGSRTVSAPYIDIAAWSIGTCCDGKTAYDLPARGTATSKLQTPSSDHPRPTQSLSSRLRSAPFASRLSIEALLEGLRTDGLSLDLYVWVARYCRYAIE